MNTSELIKFLLEEIAIINRERLTEDEESKRTHILYAKLYDAASPQQLAEIMQIIKSAQEIQFEQEKLITSFNSSANLED